MPGPLDGRVAAVYGAATPVGSAVADALAEAGARVGVISDRGESAAAEPAGVRGGSAADARPSVAADLGDRAAATAAFASLAESLGNIDVYVHAAPGPTLPCALADLSDTDFAAAWERPTLVAMWSLHGVFAHLVRPGARVVMVTPTFGMAGAPGLAAAAASVEAQRQLAKSAARQWGAEGVTVNCLAPALEVFGPHDLPPVSLAAPALGAGAAGDLTAIGALAVLLAGDGSRALTGATLTVDGGVWMAP